MRDLVETVIGQVLKKDPSYHASTAAKAGHAATQNSFQSDFMKHVNEKKDAVFVDHAVIKDKALWKASLKFEGMLFLQMMQAMRKTIPNGGLIKHGFAQGVQDSMFDQAVADAAGQRGSLGLAMNIYQQMERSSGSGKVKQSSEQHAIQAAQKVTDSERVASFSALRGGIDGAN